MKQNIKNIGEISKNNIKNKNIDKQQTQNLLF